MTTARLEAFSDGVFAIAITLLVLDIRVPAAGPRGLWHGLAHEWPSYAAYVVSFLTIGIIWVNHHATFDRIARADRTLLFLNLLLLMLVALIPFPTALMAKYLRGGAGEDVAAAVYSGTLLAMGLAFSAVTTYALRGGRLTDGSLPAPLRRRQIARSVSGQAAYALAVALAFVSAPLSLGVCALVALYYVLPGPGSRA